MKKVKETENEKLRKRIEHFLQNVYADEWHVKLVDNVYICYTKYRISMGNTKSKIIGFRPTPR